MTERTEHPLPPTSPALAALDAPLGGTAQPDDGCVTVTVEVNGVAGFAKVRRDELQHVCGLWGFRPDRRDRCPRCEANEAAAEDARSRIADREKLQPPPPATGTAARSLADELSQQIAILFPPIYEGHRGALPVDAHLQGFLDALSLVGDVIRKCPALRQPAPVAADGAGHGELRWGVRIAGKLRSDMPTTRAEAERSRDELVGAGLGSGEVVRVRVTVLADDAGADLAAIDKGGDLGPRGLTTRTEIAAPRGPVGEAGRADDAGAEGPERGPEVIPGNDRGDYQIGRLAGVWLRAHVTGSDANVLRSIYSGLESAAAACAAAEAARAAAVTECRYLRAAISEALAMVDEAYQATGYIKIAKTSEQRQRLEALAAPAGAKAGPA